MALELQSQDLLTKGAFAFATAGSATVVSDTLVRNLQQEVSILSQKVQASNEVITQLKAVIEGQHAKIDELRSGAGASETSIAIQLHMLEQSKIEHVADREARAKLEVQVRRLANHVKELKSRNEDLRKVNSRLSDMVMLGHSQESLQQNDLPSPRGTVSSFQSLENCMPVAPGSAPKASEETDTRENPPDLLSSSPSLVSQSSRSPRPKATNQTSSPCRSPSLSGGAAVRLGRAVRGSHSLWRESATPYGMLSTLLHVASQIVEDQALTLYIADPWLREEAAKGALNSSEAGYGPLMRPATFYLSGAVTIHAYRRDGIRPEPPKFTDLDNLPIRGTGPMILLPLQAGSGQAPLAVLQAVSQAPVTSAVQMGARGDSFGNSHAGTDLGNFSAVGVPLLSDSQASGLQLMCSTAGGILAMRRKIKDVKAVQGRAWDCLAITAEVHSARDVSDFEQVVKVLMARFFNVASVRICFFDAQSAKLITKATQPTKRCREDSSEAQPARAAGKHNLTKISIQDGVCGRCARRQQVIHIERLKNSPHISEQADGVDLGTVGERNMLIGPLIATVSDTSVFLGVLQLVDKRSTFQKGCGDHFSADDQDFFEKLLHIVAYAAYRTMQIQTMQLQSGDHSEAFTSFNMERLLTS